MKLIAELQMASFAEMAFFLFKSELLIRAFFVMHYIVSGKL